MTDTFLKRLRRRLLRAFGVDPRIPSPPRRDLYIASEVGIAPKLREVFREDEPLVIFDIGACEGEDSIRYARLFPNARIFAFEPVPENVALIERNLSAYGTTRVELVPCALSSEEGSAVFHLSSGAPEGAANSEEWNYGNKSSSLLPPGDVREHHPWLVFDRTIEVRTRTLDGFCRERGIERVDFIHMDVQGAELRVLEGAEGMLPTLRAVWTEVEKVPLYEGQPLADQIERFLTDHGMRKVVDATDAISGDHLYVRA